MSTKEIPLTIHYVPCAICLERTPTYPIKYSPRSVNSIQTCISQAAMTTFTFLFALTSRYIVLRTIQMKINIKCCLTVYSHFLCRTFRYILYTFALWWQNCMAFLLTACVTVVRSDT